MSDQDTKWYFNLATGEVQQGKAAGFLDRMGPYDTKEEAEHALEKAAERTRVADEYDAEEDED